MSDRKKEKTEKEVKLLVGMFCIACLILCIVVSVIGPKNAMIALLVGAWWGIPKTLITNGFKKVQSMKNNILKKENVLIEKNDSIFSNTAVNLESQPGDLAYVEPYNNLSGTY